MRPNLQRSQDLCGNVEAPNQALCNSAAVHISEAKTHQQGRVQPVCFHPLPSLDSWKRRADPIFRARVITAQFSVKTFRTVSNLYFKHKKTFARKNGASLRRQAPDFHTSFWRDHQAKNSNHLQRIISSIRKITYYSIA